MSGAPPKGWGLPLLFSSDEKCDKCGLPLPHGEIFHNDQYGLVEILVRRGELLGTRLKKLEPGGLYVLRMPDDLPDGVSQETAKAFLHEVQPLVPKDTHIIVLWGGIKLDDLPEDEMREHGWVRAEPTPAKEFPRFRTDTVGKAEESAPKDLRDLP